MKAIQKLKDIADLQTAEQRHKAIEKWINENVRVVSSQVAATASDLAHVSDYAREKRTELNDNLRNIMYNNLAHNIKSSNISKVESVHDYFGSRHRVNVYAICED